MHFIVSSAGSSWNPEFYFCSIVKMPVFVFLLLVCWISSWSRSISHTQWILLHENRVNLQLKHRLSASFDSHPLVSLSFFATRDLFWSLHKFVSLAIKRRVTQVASSPPLSRCQLFEQACGALISMSYWKPKRTIRFELWLCLIYLSFFLYIYMYIHFRQLFTLKRNREPELLSLRTDVDEAQGRC